MSYRTNGNGSAQLINIRTRSWYGAALLILSVALLTGCGDRPASASDPTPTVLSAPAALALAPTNTVQPPMILFVTPPPVRAEEPLSPDSRNIPSVFAGINEYYAVQATLTSVDQPPPPAADPATVARAVVQIRRCDNFGCETPAGSGVIVHPSGLILTAYHVLLTDPEDPNAARYPDFVIAMTENPRTAPQPRYRARLVASKADQDLALLTIDRTLDTAPLADNALALPALPLADVTTLFADDLHVLGYPVTGGDAISYTPVGFRSFDDEGRLIVVDQSLDPGNSGGPALLLRDGRFAIAGLVIRRRSTQGQLSQQGLVRAIDQLHTLTWTPRVPRAWGENLQATDATLSFQLALTLNTVDLVGQPLRLLFYATDATTDQPWQSVGMNGPLVLWADVDPLQVIARQTLTLTVPVESLGALPDRLRFRALLWETKEGNALWANTDGVQAAPRALILEPTTTLTIMPRAMSTPTVPPSPTPTPTATPTKTATPQPTATPVSITINKPTPDMTATAASATIEAVLSATPTQAPSTSGKARETVLPTQTFAAELGSVWDVAFSPNGFTLAAVTDNGLWFRSANVSDTAMLSTSDPLSSLSWSPNGLFLATGVGNRRDAKNSASAVYIWDLASSKPLAVLEGPEATILSVAWSPDGAVMAAGAANDRVYLWDVATGALMATFGQETDVTSVSWSADSNLLAASGNDGMIHIWRVATGEEVLTINAHPDGTVLVRWSPNGAMLATGGEDETLVIWNTDSGAPLLILDDLGGAVTGLVWSPDSSQVVAATSVTDENDEKHYPLRIWNATSGELRYTLLGHTMPVTGISWSAAGQQLAASARDGTTLLWMVPK